MTLFLLALGFLIPYCSAFDSSDMDLLDAIDLSSLIIFSVDLLFNFNTGFFEEGTPIRDR